MVERPSITKPKTGYYDRYFGLGVGQGGLAGYKADPYAFSGNGYVTGGTILPRRDDILIEEGGGGPRAIEKYMRLFNDSHIISAWEKLTGEIIQRKWEVDPVSPSDRDEEVAEFVRQVLYRMGTNTRQSYGKEMLVTSNSAFDTFIRGLCESLILGISIGEICWMRQGNYIVPSEIKMRDPRRFLFVLNEDGTISPRLLTVESSVEGIALPLRSMVIHRHWCYSNFMDPYGTGLGRQLYSLVEFRRTLLSFWLQYADKHTTPTAVGKFSLGTPEEEVNSLFTALQRLGQETAIVIPDEMEISWLESQGRSEVYEALIDYVDRQISFVINGENTVGQETGSVGSYARDQVSDSVRMRKAKAFSEELDETLNATLIRWIVELNYPGAPIPRLRRNFDDLEQREDPVKVVQMLTQLQAIGYEVKDLDWVRDKLEIPSLSKVDMSAMMGGGGAPGASGAPGGPPPPGQAPMAEEKNPEDVENGSMGAFGADPTSHLDLFDFSEFDESDALEEKTQKDKVAKIIASKFDGGLDDVGFQRIISSGGSEVDASSSKMHLDEYTSPGEIAYGARRVMEEIKKVPQISPDDSMMRSSLEMDLHSMENLITTGDITECDVSKLIGLYDKIYRLSRKVVYKECVVVDCKKAGYMKYFAPYFM
jgi:phage gp29-like protein